MGWGREQTEFVAALISFPETCSTTAPQRMNEFGVTAKASGAKIRLRNLTKTVRGGQRRSTASRSTCRPASSCRCSGPSGSGKTTTLNLIAGFHAADSGDILLDDRSVADVPPHKRNIGMVFQNYALFPHMTVAENVAFPLRMRTGWRATRSARRVDETLALVQLAAFGATAIRASCPADSSSAWRWRARSSSHPRLLLMDEPLGALDKKLREQMQFEIKRIHRSVGITVIYVTHDQDEALTMSDVVVRDAPGAGSPRPARRGSSTTAPANLFVADFIGDSNLLAGRVTEAPAPTLTVALDIGEIDRGRPRGEPPPRAGDRVRSC